MTRFTRYAPPMTWFLALAALSLAISAVAQTARLEIRAIQTTTLTDGQFLNGVKEGKPATIAGELRLPRATTDRLPAVVLLHGSGGSINSLFTLLSSRGAS